MRRAAQKQLDLEQSINCNGVVDKEHHLLDLYGDNHHPGDRWIKYLYQTISLSEWPNIFPILQYSCFLQTQTTRASDSIFNTHNPQSLRSVEVWETNADVGGVAAILQQQAEWNSEVIQNNDPNNTICYWVCIWWTNPMPHRTWFNWKTVLWSTHLGMIADILVWFSLSWLLWWASLI